MRALIQVKIGRMVRRLVGCVLVLGMASAPVFAQETPKPADDPVQLKETIVELKALGFLLQWKLAHAEKEAGEEKARRADLEIAELQRARETLDPSMKRKLGLPVPDAPKPDKPVPPQTPPK